MNSIRLNKKLTFIAFLISLLFHGLTTLYIVLPRINNRINNNIASPKNELKKTVHHEPWAEIRASEKNSGAPVFFHDRYEANCIEQKQTPAPIQPESEHAIVTHEHTEPQTTAEVTELTQTQPTRVTPLQTPATPKQDIQSLNPPPQQIKKIQPIPAKKTLSLAQLTKGFLDHVKEEGNHATSMRGKKNSMPTDEQMKYERYLQKLTDCLQNSLATNNVRIVWTEPLATEIHIYFVLNKNGTLRHVQLAQSSNNRQIDALYVSTFRDASNSFPPVPHYLPHDPFAMTCIIPIQTAKPQMYMH